MLCKYSCTYGLPIMQADDEKVISGSYDNTLKVWDLKTGACSLTLRSVHKHVHIWFNKWSTTHLAADTHIHTCTCVSHGPRWKSPNVHCTCILVLLYIYMYMYVCVIGSKHCYTTEMFMYMYICTCVLDTPNACRHLSRILVKCC